MRLRLAIGTLCMIASIFVANIRVSWGAEINIVSPSEATDVEGNDSVPGGSKGRVQMLFPAADFMSLPASHRTITAFAWRSDQSNTYTDPISVPLRFTLSTTTANSLSLTYANNIGGDETLVFDGTLIWQTDDIGPGPRDFDFVVQFDESFTYDPSQGNLLVDFAPEAADNVGNWELDQQLTDTITWVASNNPLDVIAFHGTQSLMVTQFTFIPEPSSLLLSLLALPAVTISRRRNSRK